MSVYYNQDNQVIRNDNGLVYFDNYYPTNPVSFSISAQTCSLYIYNFVEGTGEYQYTTTIYLTENAALNGTFTDAINNYKYYSVPNNNVWYVAIRDKNNINNKKALGVLVLSC